jgi:nucleoside-diphosphate-sugar epimerase
LCQQKHKTMRVFVTGATGFIGTAITKELIANGHQVLGLARSEASADKLKAAGAEVHRGDLENLDSLKNGAAAADGVIHAGFIHDFTRFKEVCDVDKLAIETIAETLKGTTKPLIVTSGTALVNPGRMATEDIIPPFNPAFPRASEVAADAAAEKGVRAAVVRLSPSVHGEGDFHGFVPILINLAKQKGVSAYIGDGVNRWNAVHRLDAAQLYRLALEKAEPKARYHGAAEQEIPMKDIAEAIGRKLNLPVISKPKEEATEHFGWFLHFASIDAPASSQLTQQRLNWHPTHPTLLNDLEGDVYFH